MSVPTFSAPTTTGYYLPQPPPPPGFAYPYYYASLLSRFGAMLLDLLILVGALLVIAVPLGIFAAAAVFTGGPMWWFTSFFLGPFTLLMILGWVLYFTYFEGTSGQTPGKRAAGIRVVVPATGRPPDLAHALVRTLMRVVDWLPFLYILGFLVALLTPRKQRLGDVIADTVVIRC